MKMVREVSAVCRNIRLYRKKRNMTQLELADKADLDEKSIPGIEAGRDMKLSTFLALANALSVTPNELCFEKYDDSVHVVGIAEIREKLAKLNEEQKEVFQDAVNSIVNLLFWHIQEDDL